MYYVSEKNTGKYFCSDNYEYVSISTLSKRKRFIELNMKIIVVSKWTQFRCGEDFARTVIVQ